MEHFLTKLQNIENNAEGAEKNRTRSIRQALSVLNRDAFKDAAAASALVTTLRGLGMNDDADMTAKRFGVAEPVTLGAVYATFLRIPVQVIRLDPQPMPEPVVGVRQRVVTMFDIHTRDVPDMPDECAGDLADQFLSLFA